MKFLRDPKVSAQTAEFGLSISKSKPASKPTPEESTKGTG
jgi:hypothetical protein